LSGLLTVVTRKNNQWSIGTYQSLVWLRGAIMGAKKTGLAAALLGVKLKNIDASAEDPWKRLCHLKLEIR
jgi:hypothetical protein